MQTKHFIGRWILNLAVLLMGTSSAFALPNLVPQNISLGASSVVAGGTLTVNWTLANTGSSSSPSTVTGVRLNQSSTSFTATYTSFANVSMPALNANSSTPQSTTITIPAGATPGTYYIWIIADNVTSGAITQSSYSDDEQHSVSFTVTAPAQLPNLVPQNISLGAGSVVAGNTLTVNWTLANTGGGSSPSTVTGVRLNQSSTSFTATYTSFANVSMPALSANSSTPQSTTITVPAGATPGTYYIWIIADNVTSGAITQSSYSDDEQHSVSFTVTAPAQLPNLVPQNISLGASSVVAGNTLTVNWTLANTGGGSSPSTVTGVRLNQSSTSFTATYTSFANVSMPALSANSSTPQSTTITVPAGATPGTYYIWIIADNVTSGAITQSSYSDDEQHSVSFTVTAPAQLPNLVPQNISLGASSVVAGNTLTVNWTLANTGGGSSPSTVTGVRLNQSSTSFTATYTSFANVSMPALSANSSTPQSTTITVPAGTTPGTYYVWIIADNVTSGAITQSSYTDDEQPSAAFTVTAPAQLPNLVPQNISLGAGSVVAGNTLTVNWTLANTGGGSSPSTVTGVRLNQSSTSFTATYTSFANVSMPALSANSSTPQSTTITVPAGTTPGTYYVWIIADNVTSGAITQSSYTDDEQPSAAFTVTAPAQLPNLVPQNISLGAGSVVAGNTLTVNWTLANTGGGSSPSTVTGVRLNQSSTSFTASYTSFANVSMPALSANSSTPQSTTITVPAGTTPGTYYVWIIADNVTSGAITQSSYTDDEQVSAAFTVTAPTQLPNLVPENITLSATTVAPGESLTVNWTLADTGGGNSPSTVTGVRINQSTTSFAGTTLADVSMPALNANSSTPQSTTIAVPTTPGTYYVWIIADNVIPANAISQSNYGDDEQHSVAFTVTGTLPVYNSQSAIAYARNFAKYVCSDGYFWDWSDISASNPANVGAGNPVPTGSSCDEGIGDDCAHFVSCCIGTEPNEKGGGLAVPNTTGTSAYGNPSANGLVDWLLSGSAVRESSISDLAPGDVIGYDLTGSGTVTHVVFYLGNGNVAAHAQSRLDFPWNQYPYYNVWFVHIPGGNAVLNVSATSLTLPTTTHGTAGATTTFTISGSGLGSADSLTLEAPTGSEISENGGSGFANTLLLYPDSSGTLPTTTVYARISASATANVNGNLTIQDALNNALDKTILVGSVSLATDAQKQSLILQMINSHRGILPPELALAVIFQEGGQGAFYVDGSVLSPFFYRQADGPWAQPDDNNDGVMQVQQASRASGLTGPYPNTQSGYDVAISDGCSYLLTQYQSYETLWESVLHYNSGGASLYIYDNGEGDPQYLYHVASNLRNLVPALYGINNAQLADQLNAAQNIVNTYLQNSAILPNQSQSYYTAYQAQMDSALHALGSVSTKNLTLTASLSFGNIAIGSSQTLLMNVANNGNSTLTVNSINYPNGFSGNWASGPISPGGSVNVTVAFTPGNSTGYGGNITINSDATSGASEVAVSGAGVIHNELVNRRNLSSAAAAARMRLIERMFTDAGVELLGMNPAKKPPEMSMYLSVLKNTGLHQKRGDTWQIGEPHYKTDEKCGVLPALRLIREIVQKEADSRVSIAALFAELRKPPYGVRDGIIPLLLTVFAIANEKDVAFYKDGTFLRELNAEAVLVLTKAPERFDIQYCKIEGVRAELFAKLLTVLEVEASHEREVELLDVVKKLCVFVAQLPAYVLNTKNLPSTALAVRDIILNAREPAKLLFIELPKACGFDPILSDATATKPVQAFVKTLKTALDDLRAAFPELQERLRKELRDAFNLPGTFQQFRTSLAGRAEQVVLGVNEPKLRAFCLRLMDDNLPESDWLESLGSYLALKPPSKWHDAEEDAFDSELAQCATRFHRVESIVFAGGKSPANAVGIRLAITQANGVEHEQVVHFTADEEQQLRGLQAQFEILLTKDKRLGLAAASRAIWVNLEKEGKTKL